MSGACCIAGELHAGTPVGREEHLHGLNCYVSDPLEGSSKATIVILTDVFGWKLPNTRILADQYAKRLRMRTIVPDFFNGKSVKPMRQTLMLMRNRLRVSVRLHGQP
jgi:hypothetical protein